MRTLDRNKVFMWYANYKEKTKLYDSDGYETGEFTEVYDTPVKIYVHTQPVDSDEEVQKFGIKSRDTLWVLLQKQDFKFNEASALWFGTDPVVGGVSIKPTHRVAGIMPGLNQVVIYAKEL